MQAKLYKADTPNVNGWIYSKKDLEEAVRKFNSSSENFIVAGPYPPASQEIDLEKVAAMAELSMEDDYVVAKIQFLQTSIGKASRQIFETVGLSVLPVAYGSLSEDKHVTDIVLGKLTFVTPEDTNVGENEHKLFVIEDK